MDRELVLAVLSLVLCGCALQLAGCCARTTAAAGALERQAWRRLWLPLAPALLVLLALCGWALVEPAHAERVPNSLLWGAFPFALVLVRAAWRAVRALARGGHDISIGTVGVLRPRVIVSPRVAAGLDARALAAACAHEQAHARHRDPTRLWLAQLGSDLLWPWPAAQARLRCWRHALELARDAEARHHGAGGADLAAAILAALRRGGGGAPASAATLGGDAAFLAERITRLMLPLEVETPGAAGGALWAAVLALAVVLAVLLGTQFGEHAVRTLLACA